MIEDNNEFMCRKCGKFFPEDQKGKATLDDKPYDVCKGCCYKEQMKQFLCDL